MTDEHHGTEVFTFRLQPRFAVRMDAIRRRDPDVDNRTDAIKAALTYYDDYLARKEQRASAKRLRERRRGRAA
jgi:hypothetical protein